MTFNIYHGETMKGDFNLDVIAKVINDANPDFVALQEVDHKTNRAKKYDLVTFDANNRSAFHPDSVKPIAEDLKNYVQEFQTNHAVPIVIWLH